jgi:hypothetical protein
MKFIEVTDKMLGAVINAPGHPDHQKTMADALPDMKQVRIWRAYYGGYSWVISYDPGHKTWDADERQKWAGYNASYRKEGHTNSSETITIEGGPWHSFAAAEGACLQRWRQLRSLS